MARLCLRRAADLWVFFHVQRFSTDTSVPGAAAYRPSGQCGETGEVQSLQATLILTILRADTIDGKKYYVLELTAVDRSVTYNKVLYWVQQSNFWPYRAEFYSLSNQLLKNRLPL